jgi:hypothetical protein
MSSPQWRLEAVTNTTAYLIAQLRELEGDYGSGSGKQN